MGVDIEHRAEQPCLLPLSPLLFSHPLFPPPLRLSLAPSAPPSAPFLPHPPPPSIHEWTMIRSGGHRGVQKCAGPHETQRNIETSLAVV